MNRALLPILMMLVGACWAWEPAPSEYLPAPLEGVRLGMAVSELRQTRSDIVEGFYELSFLERDVTQMLREVHYQFDGGKLVSIRLKLVRGLDPVTLFGEELYGLQNYGEHWIFDHPDGYELQITTDLNELTLKMAKASEGWPPVAVEELVAAVRFSDLEKVKKLLAAGTSVNTPDRSGQRALTKAVLSANFEKTPETVEIIRILLEHGADPNLKEPEDGATALHWSVSAGPDVVEMLLKSGADPKLEDNEGLLPRDWVFLLGDKADVERLLELLTPKLP